MTVNDIVLPDHSEQLVLESIRQAHNGLKADEDAERATALDFYYHDNVDQHIEQYFSPSTLNQVPVFVISFKEWDKIILNFIVNPF